MSPGPTGLLQVLYINGKIGPFVGFLPSQILSSTKMDCLASPYTLLLLFFTSLAVAQNSPRATEVPYHQSIAGGIGAQTHPFLSVALAASGLIEILDKQGPFTFFIPSDEAFKSGPGLNFAELLEPENRNALRSVLTYHMVAGRYSASKILRALCRGAGTAAFTTVQGNEILASMEGTDILLTDCSGNTARITMADGNRQNGVIHVIDRVILPQ
jgi:uncharacterized surface protein with fasciclin (FAS1) repeats